MHGVCYTEFFAEDSNKSAEFFSKVFGWQSKPFAPGYHTWSSGEEKPHESESGGLSNRMPPGTKTLSYIHVENIPATLAKVKELGGRILVEYESLGNDMGAIGIFVTQDGTPMGLWARH